jgi:predicted butyrate kinase (DUF1464 family)
MKKNQTSKIEYKKSYKIIGIDPGTKSFDILGIEFIRNKEKIFLDKTIPSEKVAGNPEILLSEIKPFLPVKAIIGPSGYGLPLTKLADASDNEINQMLPMEEDITGGISVNEGIKRLFWKMKEMKLPVYFTPGIIHLTTVPEYRKLNRMDMGTADKLCCVALAMKDQMKRLRIRANQTSFILLEMGYGFTAAIAVKNGQAIDGLGGTSGFPGFLGTGSLDGELAIRLGKQRQGILFTGGASSITKNIIKDVSKLSKNKDVLKLLIESALKDIACLFISHPDPKEIILSGRLCRVPVIYREIIKSLKKHFPNLLIRRVHRTAKIAKEATEGAVLLGAGILDIKYTDIFKALKIADAKGTMYDYIKLNLKTNN